MKSVRRVDIPQTECHAAIRQIDITPPSDIYHRMWGAASHDRANGVHRPLTATVLVLEHAPNQSRWVIVAMDHCLLWHREMNALLDGLSDQSDASKDELTVFFSHTHAAGLMGWERESLPGGDLIRPYLDRITRLIAEEIDNALTTTQPVTIVYGQAECDLARNRDYWDDDREGYVCGFNPSGPADSRVVVAKLTAVDSGDVLGTMVNYACHPTTLAWDNQLISPDYVGAMREVIQGAYDGAPCCFVQGASGDIGPLDGFVGDTDVADRNGRQLGYAALSALESAVGGGKHWSYQGAVVSGATIGAWALASGNRDSAAVFQKYSALLMLPYRDDLPDPATLLEDKTRWEQAEQGALKEGDAAGAADARAMAERMTRRLTRVGHIPEGGHFPYQVVVWRLGDALWIPLNGEHYNLLQRALRERFPNWQIVIGTLANGSDVWYLPDADSYGRGLYQEDASVLAKGSLELLLEALTDVCQTATQARDA